MHCGLLLQTTNIIKMLVEGREEIKPADAKLAGGGEGKPAIWLLQSI